MNCTKPRQTLIAAGVSRAIVPGGRCPTTGSRQMRVWLGRGPITYPTGQPFESRKLVETGTSLNVGLKRLAKAVIQLDQYEFYRNINEFLVLAANVFKPLHYLCTTKQPNYTIYLWKTVIQLYICNVQIIYWKKYSMWPSICTSMFVWQINIHVEALLVHTNRDIQIDRCQNITRSLEILLDLVRNIARITPGRNKNSHSIIVV